MPDDPFADLGRGRGDDGRSAAERLAEIDERDPEPDIPKPAPPPARPGGRYMWVVGAAFSLLVIVAMLNVLRGSDEDDLIQGLRAGTPIPDFAAPSATGTLTGDANVRPPGEASEAAGRRPACEVRSPQVVNVCDLRRRPLVLSFLVTQGANCGPQVDALDRVRREFPQVSFAAVLSRSDQDDARRLVRERGWTLPVAVDRDGAVINLYQVGVCPATVFARAGGRVATTKLGPLDERALRAEVRALLEAPR